MLRSLVLSIPVLLVLAASSALAQDVASRILEFFPGKWQMKSAEGALLAEADWKLVAGGKAIAGPSKSADGVSSHVMAGWDPVQKVWLHIYHREDGAFQRLIVRRFEGDTYYGEITRTDPDGEAVTAEWEAKIINRNLCELTQRAGDKEIVTHFERVE